MGSPVSSLSSQSTSSTSVVPQTEAVSQVKIMATDAAEPKPKKKICCACPETKRLRDECIVEHGEVACTKWIEAHRMCLRAEGFKV